MHLFVYLFCANLILNIKVVSLSRNLAPRIIYSDIGDGDILFFLFV